MGNAGKQEMKIEEKEIKQSGTFKREREREKREGREMKCKNKSASFIFQSINFS